MMCSFSSPLFTAVCNTANSLCFVVFFLLGDSLSSEFLCDILEHSVCSIIICGVSRTPYTLCNFTMFSVAVGTQIGTVHEADHTLTTE